jgi:TolB-like protein
VSFFAELKRRNVVRVGLAYVIVGWLLAQVAEFAAENFGAPDWVLKMFVIFLVLGLPMALFFAWAFELTPEGIMLEKHVEREESITHRTGRKLDFIIIGVMAVALIYMVADKFIGEPEITEITETAVPEDKSIAVLPFVNMSDDKDYFADGLSEELLNLLVRIPDLKVAGRTSSFSFKGRNEDLRLIGDALDVSTVLEGSVRRSGDRLRITAQLVSVEDGYHIWSETYDRTMADIFDIQDDVASKIISALELHLASDSTVEAGRPTQNAEAYGLYLEALAVFQEDGPLFAIELLDRALALDPRFAKAHEQKAVLYWNAAAFFMDSAKAQKLTYESAQAALSIDPSLVGAQTFMATANTVDWTWSKELYAVERATGAMPTNLGVLSAYCWDLAYVGYFRESLECADRMIALEPLATSGYQQKGMALIAMDRRAEAHDAWQLAFDAGFPGVAIFNIIDHFLQAEDEMAIEFIESLYRDFALAVFGLEPGSVRAFVENARNPTTGRQYLRETVTAIVKKSDYLGATINAYTLYLAFGDLDAYYDVIYEMTDVDTAWTNSDNLELTGRVFKVSGYSVDSRFGPLRNKWGMLDLWDERGPPDDCEKVDGNWLCE